jgi:uracil-DNA glycosylase family 4
MRTPIEPDPLLESRLDIMACSRCRLGTERRAACPGDGAASASVFVIGEAPGRQDNKSGHVFSGDAGSKLDSWLRRAGLRTEECFFTNVLKCAPLKEATRDDGTTYLRMSFPEDDPEPVEKCSKWLKEQLRVIQPLVIVLVGQRALQHVLLPSAVGQARPFAPWVNKFCRRRDKFGEIRFASIMKPGRFVRTPNPYDEAACIEALVRVRDYVRAVENKRMPPLEDLHEVKGVTPPQYQHRIRLFGRGKPGQPSQPEDTA